MQLASLALSATYTKFELEARRNLMGVSRWCTEVATAGKLSRLGERLVPGMKAVIRMNPNTPKPPPARGAEEIFHALQASRK